MILMIMVIKMIRMTMIIGQSWQWGRGCGTSSDCDQTACPRWWSRYPGFLRSDCVHTIVLGYKMTTELKGENHKKVFYKVEQQAYILFWKHLLIVLACYWYLLFAKQSLKHKSRGGEFISQDARNDFVCKYLPRGWKAHKYQSYLSVSLKPDGILIASSHFFCPCDSHCTVCGLLSLELDHKLHLSDNTLGI